MVIVYWYVSAWMTEKPSLKFVYSWNQQITQKGFDTFVLVHDLIVGTTYIFSVLQ